MQYLDVCFTAEQPPSLNTVGRALASNLTANLALPLQVTFLVSQGKGNYLFTDVPQVAVVTICHDLVQPEIVVYMFILQYSF